MVQLALLRHGHTPWNRAGRIQGRTDIPLDAGAETQLGQLVLPAPWDQADLVASPLARAVQTAQLVAGRSPRKIDALTEMDWGTWEGQHGADLIAQEGSGYRHIEEWGWDFRPPEGESPAEVWNRLRPWVWSLKRDTIAICHIGIMRVLMAKATGWEFSGAAPFAVKRNRMFIITLDAPRIGLLPDAVRLIERPS